MEGERVETNPLNDVRRGADEIRALRDEFSEVLGEVRAQVRGEFDLARTGAREQASIAATSAAWGALAIVAALFALGFAGLTAIAGLQMAMPLWAGALIVTGAYLFIAAAAGLTARARLAALTVIPKRTIQSIREDFRWAQRQFSSNTN